MSNIDQQFIEYVVKSLVGKPEAVIVERRIDEKGVLLELTVDPEDLGRVIGKRGATAQSLRTLLRALGTKNDARYNLKIIDNGVGGYSNSDDSDAPAKPAPAQKAQPDDTPTDDVVTEDAAPAPEEVDETSDRLKAARAELADLDDLDV
ncbi:MAG: RNA-binding protein [Candidatus Saccharibacteria bacterium]|nr:RNA-binding protein [Candidatus Saccharibacteria bacterium]